MKSAFRGTLPFDLATNDEDVQDKLRENRRRISISGFQEKYSLVLEKNRLRLTKQGEQGTFILKPPPHDPLRRPEEIPANEHLTMQIARQVFGIHTAENAMIFSPDGTPAYITRRFDLRPDGRKWGVEDFASLSNFTQDNAGEDFKFNSSYEEMGLLIQNLLPAWRIEIERFFTIVVFNYLFSNGDAHLKNFSLLETVDGDYRLSPAYDLMDSYIHVSDADFALHKGLFADTILSKHAVPAPPATGKDFVEFGRRIGILERRMDALLKPFQTLQNKVELMTERSFLTESSKNTYIKHYRTKRNRLDS
ncbi:MAG: HipA domain-containing protein [Bacteroidia bacterium]